MAYLERCRFCGKEATGEYATNLPEGRVNLYMPVRLSNESARDFIDWMEIILRKLRKQVLPVPPDHEMPGVEAAIREKREGG